ncbi:MAG: hypothetical protein HN849_22265, partial [Victivallales bacterium]|nr:hypothetical protein [Victivallales bacterium]
MTNLTSRVREQGVALMMTLGILSLILILAMSFAFTARTNRMLSQTNADMTRSRLLAKSALERVIADLGYTFHSSKYIKTGGPDDADDRSCIYPATSDAPFAVFGTGVLAEYGKQHVWISSKNDGDDVGAKEALTCLGGVPGSGRFPELGTLPSSAGWEHRKEYRKQPGTPVTFREELVGRISFAVIGESGKIDPGGVLTVNGEPYWGATPADGFYDLDLDTSPDAFNYTPASFTDWNETKIPRLGLSPQEIRLHSDYAEGFWKSLPPVGNKAADWFSWRHIAAGLTADGSTLLMTSATRAEMLEEYFPYSYDCESYMYLDYSVDTTELEEKHRTDLWALPWETQDWLTDTDDLDWLGAYPLDDAGGVTGRGPDNFRDAATGNIQAANTDPANSTGGVPAFGQFTSEAVTRSTLINIIDNADPDNEASVLPAGSEWDIVNVGCEIQPYLNEIGIEVTYTWDDGADDTITTDDTGTVSITMCLELAEIYGIA